MKTEKWVMRWRSWIAPKPSRPGVWRRKEGGFLVRGRVVDARTGKMREVRMTLLDLGDAGLAYEELQRELRKAKEGRVEEPAKKTCFRSYAVSLLERKIAAGEIKSAKTRERWGYILKVHLLPAFGSMDIEDLRRADVEDWKAKHAPLHRKPPRGDDAKPERKLRKYAPQTVNGWLAVLRVILNTAVAELELDRNPVAGVSDFDTSEWATYTEEEPNSLTPDEVPAFLMTMRREHPQHFAFVALGIATGLRPSSLRPLRRTGATPDVLWDDGGAVLIRRSHTRRSEVMETTKTGIRQKIALPPEMMDILRWHVAQLPDGPMKKSDLLFPSNTGGLRSASCLDKPFDAVAKAMALSKAITPRSMRRTFQDLARAAEVKDIVTRAVSGHATETMQRHYSTVRQDEIRSGLAKVIDLAGFKQAVKAAGEATSEGSGGVQGGVHEPEKETAGGR